MNLYIYKNLNMSIDKFPNVYGHARSHISEFIFDKYRSKKEIGINWFTIALFYGILVILIILEPLNQYYCLNGLSGDQ